MRPAKTRSGGSIASAVERQRDRPTPENSGGAAWISRFPSESAICANGSPASGAIFDLPRREKEIAALEEQTLRPDFWSDRQRAQQVSQKIASLKRSADTYRALDREFTDTVELIELAEADGDDAMVRQLVGQLEPLAARIEKVELATFLSEQYDDSAAYLSIKPGAGGTESRDWAAMLMRMYTRYLERAGFTFEILDLQQEEVGISAVTLLVKGDYAYGYLKGEKGVHRLVRISPFDANKRRQTSFAAVDVMPELPADADIEIKDADIELNFFRSSGAGGQHVNKTSSAVRIVHKPTGLVVACQNERSQHQNREVALGMLKAKLFKLQQEEHEAKVKGIAGEKKVIGFGSQIRSYVFCPYTLVKDLRTGEQTGSVHQVMDGDLDHFLVAYLKWHAAGEKPLGIADDEEA